MGRSVNYLDNATEVTFFNLEDEEFSFEDLYGNIVYTLNAKYDSLTIEDNKWDNGETRIILENQLVQIGISEYCGVVSVSIRPNEMYYKHEGLAQNFIAKSWDNMVKAMRENTYHEALNMGGRLSNGGAVFFKA